MDERIDSPYAWLRLGIAVALSTIGGVGMWSVVVALPAVQQDFAVGRSAASLPFTLTMIGFALGGVVLGRLSDRVGLLLPLIGGTAALSLGYVGASFASDIWQFTIVYGLLIGIGCSATFVPLLADVSHWFERRRGIAVAICTSGNYIAGTVWPPVVEHFIAAVGWRVTHLGIGIFCSVAMLPLTLLLRRRPPLDASSSAATNAPRLGTLGLRPSVLQGVLAVAGLCCCVAMSMPQVHLVAYCGDLGYGAARGAQMLSLMLGLGILSRIGSGFIADRIGGIATLMFGSLAQMTALSLFLMLNSLTSLYVISALFGLFQGGLVPSYAIIVRECFPAKEAGGRVGIVMMATLFGMAVGGWLSGAIFDLTGSYEAAFANGVAWNLPNALIAFWLLMRASRRKPFPLAGEVRA
jgi:MFS family permease